jgi:hypothetical protein
MFILTIPFLRSIESHSLADKLPRGWSGELCELEDYFCGRYEKFWVALNCIPENTVRKYVTDQCKYVLNYTQDTNKKIRTVVNVAHCYSNGTASNNQLERAYSLGSTYLSSLILPYQTRKYTIYFACVKSAGANIYLSGYNALMSLCATCLNSYIIYDDLEYHYNANHR